MTQHLPNATELAFAITLWCAFVLVFALKIPKKDKAPRFWRNMAGCGIVAMAIAATAHIVGLAT